MALGTRFEIVGVEFVKACVSHSLGVNDLCDGLQLHSGPLVGVRGAAPPSLNGLSNANRERPSEMAEHLFWQVLDHLGKATPGFVQGRHRGAPFRFKVHIHVVDTTVMELVELCAGIKSGEIVKRSDDLAGFKVLPHRWVVERTFGWLMRQRRLVPAYETTESSTVAWIYIAMIRIQLRRLA